MTKRPKKKTLTRAEVLRSFPLPPQSPKDPKWDGWLDPDPEESDEYRDILPRTKNSAPKSTYFTSTSEEALLRRLRASRTLGEFQHSRDGWCEICNRESILLERRSRLDGVKRWCCPDCRKAHAEAWAAVAGYCRSYPDRTPEAAWRRLPRKLKAMIRFWINDRYLPYGQAFRIQLRQQLIPVFPRAGERDGLDEHGAERLRVIMREWRAGVEEEPEDEPPARPSPSFMARLESLLVWLGRPFIGRYAYGA